MRNGLLMQQGAPQQVYDDPQNLFVAKFLGTPPINVFEGEVKGGVLQLGGQPAMDVPGCPGRQGLCGHPPRGL